MIDRYNDDAVIPGKLGGGSVLIPHSPRRTEAERSMMDHLCSGDRRGGTLPPTYIFIISTPNDNPVFNTSAFVCD